MTGSFAAEVMCMMYVAGDVEEPDVRTAEYVETIGKILNEWLRLQHKKINPHAVGIWNFKLNLNNLNLGSL